ncbi:Protein OS-9 [Coemansia nantahalensis]|nr:Protein OS-9 [Coemansia nantahalensis]
MRMRQLRLRWGPFAALLAAAGVVLAAGVDEARVFSPADIMDDVHEVPRFRIRMLDELLPASKLSEAVDALRSRAHDAEQRQAAGEAASEAAGEQDGAPAARVNASTLIYDPVVANAGNRWRFVCQVPRMASIRSAMAAEMASQAEAVERDVRAEEQGAIVRGLELLRPLQNTCFTYKSGLWFFEYCHNRSVRQYYRMAPDKNGRVAEIEYILGEYSHRRRLPTLQLPADSTDADSTSSAELLRTTHIHKDGRRHYLAQLWAGGTICDVTRQPRDVEIQYHCDPTGPERIAMVEEVAICQYVVVIHTPRLCVDAGFYDTAASTVFNISCQHVVPDSEYNELMARDRLIRPPPLADEMDEADDDSVPLALLGRGLDGNPGTRGDVAAELGGESAAKAASDGKQRQRQQKPQVVVSLSDPALIEATRQRKEVLRRLLEFAYGDIGVAVKFAEGASPDEDEVPPAADAGRGTRKTPNAHEEL